MKKRSAILIPALVVGTMLVLPAYAQESGATAPPPQSCVSTPAATPAPAPTPAPTPTSVPAPAPETVINPVNGGAEIEYKSTTVRWEQLSEKQKQLLEGFLALEPELRDLLTKEELQLNERDGSWGVAVFSKKGIGSNVRLFFDGNGRLQQYNASLLAWASEKIPSDKIAEEKAAAFARYAMGDELANYKMLGVNGGGGSGTTDEQGKPVTWTSSSVSFQRLIKGIPVQNESGIQIDVDGAGHVSGFMRGFGGIEEQPLPVDEAAYPDPTQAISAEKVKEIYANQLKLKLAYNTQMPVTMPRMNESPETRVVLTYSGMETEYVAIDALTGVPVKDLYGFSNQTEPQSITVIGGNQQWKANSPTEAAALITQLTGVDLSGMEGKVDGEFFGPPSKSSKGEGDLKAFTWQSQAPKDGQPITDEFIHAFAVVDKKTGQLQSFSINKTPGDPGKAVIKEDVARKTALEFLQKSMPSGSREIVLSDVYGPESEQIPSWVDRSKLSEQRGPVEYSYLFMDTYQGVPVVDRGYSVTVNGITGKVTSWNGVFSEMPALPDKTKVVSADVAKAEFLKNRTLKLAYIWPQYQGQRAPKPSLVYIPDFYRGFSYIDAVTGETVKVPME